MERLLVSVSPLPSDANRFHSLFTNSQSTGDRYATLSPTADASHHTYATALSKSTDKHLQQLSKSVQSYGNDRYQLSTSQNDQFDRNATQDRYNDRFQQNDRYHSTDRYSPVRTTDKYLSLPKPKDRYSSGRVTSSCSSISSASSERAYASGNSSYVPPTAHTPVERYVTLWEILFYYLWSIKAGAIQRQTFLRVDAKLRLSITSKDFLVYHYITLKAIASALHHITYKCHFYFYSCFFIFYYQVLYYFLICLLFINVGNSIRNVRLNKIINNNAVVIVCHSWS